MQSKQQLEYSTSPLNNYGFRYREVASAMLPEQQLLYLSTLDYNAIFLQLEGELLINWEEHTNVLIKPGEMYFLPRGASVSACILSGKISYVVSRLDHNLDNDKAFSAMIKFKDENDIGKYSFAPLTMNQMMINFAESVKDYMIRGLQSSYLHTLKLSEMQIILSKSYSTLDCARLFYPIVGFKSDFENFILNNYDLSTSIEELASKANMSRSTFDRKFKDVFKVTPLKWMEDQIRKLIINKSSEPNITVKDIMYEVGVYNPSQFTKLCKRLCGVTPSELIHSS